LTITPERLQEAGKRKIFGEAAQVPNPEFRVAARLQFKKRLLDAAGHFGSEPSAPFEKAAPTI
jgi:hypothetical protein